jgi:hypothetical protein
MNEINKFKDVITQMHDSEDTIHSVIHRISSAKLFSLPPFPKSSVDLTGMSVLKAKQMLQKV